MTPKELLYIEDALSHEQHMQLKCCNYAAQLKDPQLKAFVEQLSKSISSITTGCCSFCKLFNKIGANFQSKLRNGE